MLHRAHSATGLVLLLSLTAAAGTSALRGGGEAPAAVPVVAPTEARAATTVPMTIAATTVPTTAGVTTTTAPVPASPVVVFYGDSLGWEASDQLVAQFAMYPTVQVVTRTFGGTAICDWFDQMRDDVATLAPWVAIVQFSGNALTPCMADPAGNGVVGEAYLARYRSDARTAAEILGASARTVFLVGAPVARDAARNPDYNGGALNSVYRQLADGEQVVYVDAGAAVLDRGRWTGTLPCLPEEPCTGGVDADGQPVNVVRAPDGGHFCPAGEEAKRGVTGSCPVWSSGAYRFAAAIAAPVLVLLGPGLLG